MATVRLASQMLSMPLNYLFLGGELPGCLSAADTNADGEVDISDAAYTLSFLFLGGPGLPAPTSCGNSDSESDEALGCEMATLRRLSAQRKNHG